MRMDTVYTNRKTAQRDCQAQGSMKTETKGTYTLISHEYMDSVPGRLLSGGARSAFFDFLRLWSRKTRNGKHKIRAVSWTWTGLCGWCVSRKSYGVYQRELEEYGFVDCVSRHSGHWILSNRWQAYTSPQNDRERLERHDREREKRRNKTIESRKSRAGNLAPVIGIEDKARIVHPAMKDVVEKDLPHAQGVIVTPPTGSNSYPYTNTTIPKRPPPTPSTVNGAQQAWPTGLTASQFENWAEDTWANGELTDDKHDLALAHLKELQTKEATEARKARKEFTLDETLDNLAESEAAFRISKAIGYEEARDTSWIQGVIRSYGIRATRMGALELIREGVGRENSMKWIMSRAKAYAGGTRRVGHE